jgi:Phosphopantetheinyl transferase component of siderophore synthetase
MNIKHTTLPFAGHTIHRIDFIPETFTDTDLLWLPHHHKLSHAGRKRKAEHLAGRIAAFHALREQGMEQIPDIGEQRQPIWPAGCYGSISHCGNAALALISRQPTGIDLEAIFSPAMCHEIADSLIAPAEQQVLAASGLPFRLALTLVFSAKESLYKALSPKALPLPGFLSVSVVALDNHSLTLQLSERFTPDLDGQRYRLAWRQLNNTVMTLCTETLQPA